MQQNVQFDPLECQIGGESGETRRGGDCGEDISLRLLNDFDSRLKQKFRLVIGKHLETSTVHIARSARAQSANTAKSGHFPPKIQILHPKVCKNGSK